MGLAGADARPSAEASHIHQLTQWGAAWHLLAAQGSSDCCSDCCCSGPGLLTAMDALSMEAARSWHWMGNLEEDLAVPLDDNPAYDLRAVLDRGERDRLSGAPASLSAGDWT